MPARRRARATTATCFPRRDAHGPGPQVLRLRRTAAKDRDGGLNQEPARARVAGLGDRAPALRLARAALAGHEADAGDGAQTRHARILDGEVFDRGVGVRELGVEGTHEGEQWRDDRAQAARQGEALDPVNKMLRTAGGDAVAVLAEQGSDDGDVARAGPDEGVADDQAAAHM